MQAIIAPIRFGDSGANVANLQDALRLLLDRGVIRGVAPPSGSPMAEELAKLVQRLAEERAQSRYGDVTQRLVLYVQGLDDGLNGTVEEKTAVRLNEIVKSLGVLDSAQGFVVRGTVRDANGKALPGIFVRALDRDLRPKRSQPLGEPVVSGELGFYEIHYTTGHFARAEAGGPDIQVQAFDSPALDHMLGESAVLHNAGSEATIDLTLGTAAEQPSEFESHIARVLRLLEGQADDGGNLALTKLEAPDIAFIVADTGLDKQHVEWLHAAHQTAEELKSEPARAACYGWFRKGIDARVGRLRAQSPSVLRQSLKAAIDENIVPTSLRESVETVLELIGNAGWSDVKGLLHRAGLPDKQFRAIAQTLDSVEAVDDVALRGFVQASVLDESQAHQLGLAASLHRLTAANGALLESALKHSFDALGNRRLSKSEDLARLSHDDWVTLLSESGAPVPDGSNVEAYATELEEAAVGAYPTVGMMHRVLRASPDSPLARVVSRNTSVDLLSLDLTADSADVAKLDLAELTEAQAEDVKTRLRAMQRMLSAGSQHPTRAQKLLDAGYHTATRIALATQAELMEKAGLTEREALQVLDRARTASLQAVHAWMAVRDAQADRQMISGVGKALFSKSPAEAQIARWIDLFGSADYCDCDHCQSVLGPAAYFVDLMRYIETRILEPSQNVPAEMQLPTRRKDLWDDKLISCESTDEIVPTLDIVNELLERWIRTNRPAWSTPLEIHRGIADPASSPPDFSLPVNFPLDRLEILLAHFGLSRGRIVQVLGGTGRARIQSRLKTWPSELALVQKARADDATAESYFVSLYKPGGAVIPNGPGFLDRTINGFALKDLQFATGLDLDVLRLLVRSGFVSPDGSGVPAVVVTLTAPQGAVQNTTESVTNLTRRRLDRLHRLVRLWRKLPWTVQELDYALKRLTPDSGVTDLGDTTLESIVDLLDLGDATGLAFEEVMALWDDIPREGFQSKTSLFDRRFNPEPFARAAAWPGNALPRDLALPVTAAPTDSTAARVLSGLRMTESDFAELIDSLKEVKVPEEPPLGNLVRLVTLTGTVPQSLHLSTSTLSVLYRHALLCRVLKVKPAVLIRLVRLTPEIAERATAAEPLEAQCITSLADVKALHRFVAWQRASGFSVEDLDWLVDRTHRPDDEPDPSKAAERAIARISGDRLVVFPATVFTATGFSEQQSREIMASLEGAAVERTVVQASRAAGAATNGSAPQEAEYRLKSGVTDQVLEDLVANATSPWAFDIEQIAVLGLARQLGEFDDTAFTKLFLTSSESKELVKRNLDDGLPTSPRRAFVEFKAGTVPPTLRYRLNPAFLSASEPGPIGMPEDTAGSRINLAGRLVLGFLKQKASEITQGTPSAAHTVPDTLFTEIFLSEQQSRWLVALNPVVVDTAAPEKSARAFLPDPTGKVSVLNLEGIRQATGALVPRDTLSAVRLSAVALLRAFDPLVVADRVVAAEVGVAAEVLVVLRQLASPGVQGNLGGVQAIDAAEVFGDLSPPVALATLVAQLQRLKRLFGGTRFDAAVVRLVLNTWSAAFEGRPGNAALDIERLKAIAAYAVWLRLPEQPQSSIDPKQVARRDALEALVLGGGPTSLGDPQWNPAVAKVLDATEAEVRSLAECPQIWQGKWHKQLDRAARALEITRRLGVGGRTLARIGAFDPATATVDDLSKAADDIYGAFRAKYADEATYREKSEAFEDLIRGKRRDALVAYISAGAVHLRTRSLMYGHFLMDVEAGGCARTSRLVAAISSLQLFVHRVLMDLERDPTDRDRRYKFGANRDGEEARDQWFWRKNYRVWEANRKVFLFPENFIEPDLRDDKTPLFRALEDELLQRRITIPEAEESYRNYLAGYSEVAGLRIVGAFHDLQTGRDLGIKVDGAADIFIDVLHIVGVTADDPPVHYLRRIGNLTRSRGRDGSKYPLRFTPWEKLSAQIPMRLVSPVVYLGKVRLFWNEIATVSTTRRLKAGTYFDGYKHQFKVKWIEQKASGGWTAPQEVAFLDEKGRPTRSYADALQFVIKPGVSVEAPAGFRNQEDAYQTFYPDQMRRQEALPALEQDQPYASAKVWLEGLIRPEHASSTETESVSTFSGEEVDFKAVPGSQPHQRPDWDTLRHHGSADEDFTVAGWNWERVFPAIRYVAPSTGQGAPDESLQLAAMNPDKPGYVHGFLREPDRRIRFVPYEDIVDPTTDLLSAHLTNGFVATETGVGRPPWFNIAVGNHFWKATAELLRGGSSASGDIVTFGAPVSEGTLVVNARAEATKPSDVGAPGVNPFRASCIVESGNVQALLINDATRHAFVNLSTSTAAPLGRRLATGSVPGLLDRAFQNDLSENLTFVRAPGGIDVVKGTELDFEGAYGTYLREIFFHVPFLVANHLNSQQRFEDSQRWYHYIFNPMAQDAEGPWRYCEFVGRPVESLREVLTNATALAAYRNDPFNPHAIARLRLSAYQKAIVMKYIDNLLDWGDKLFAHFTMESVNEATMLYVLAADILGERPNRLPKCREETARSYSEIKPSLNDVSDFLIEEMEQLSLFIRKRGGMTIQIEHTHGGELPVFARMASRAAGVAAGAPGVGAEGDFAPLPGTGGAGFDGGTGPRYWSSEGGRPLAELYAGGGGSAGGFSALGTDSSRYITPPIDFEGGSPGGGGIFGGKDFGEVDPDPTGLIPGRSVDIKIKHSLHDAPPLHKKTFEPRRPEPNHAELVPARNIFCFPVNKDLLAYHDRVNDRLTKIRNCMDIAGVRRRLALFAPEIDPRLLVRMKAAGLSLDDVLDSTSGHAPPYRFTFLLERARQYAGTVQSLGAQLLSAMEKRDGEELAVLRTVHEQHLLDLRTQSMRMEIDAANDTLAGAQRQKEAAELRQSHFESLLSGGMIPSEQAQQAFVMFASGLGMASATIELVAAVAALLPQVHVGVAAAAESGGLSAANAASHIAGATRSGATVADWGSKAAGTQASFERRAQDWKFQGDVARKDVAQLTKQVEAATIRVAIAERALEVHQKSIEQTREVFDFYRAKFSSHGLYTWLSTQLNRYHRMAFDAAWNMARMAEKALHFERPELREAMFLGDSGWSPGRAGLLSGESLLLELQRLEAGYLLTNTRQLEVEQSFSLAQYRPDKLLELRQTGECDFEIPELFFDLSYPGQYFRRIKAVRLSMPCVVGPHTSIGATLRMTHSLLRDVPDADQALKEVPLRHAPTIAASSGQGDAGVFEFSFRDERLLPFEGMGAVSSWSLSLPKELRPFRYDTISDVILRINYTAREDDTMRERVDKQNGAMSARLRDAAPRVALNLRRDFPTEWSKFQEAPAVNNRFLVTVPLTELNYPFWLRGRFNEEEDLVIHVVFEKSPSGSIDVKLDDRSPDAAEQSGVRWFGIFAAGKGKGSRELRMSFNSNDMADVVMVFTPAGQT